MRRPQYEILQVYAGSNNHMALYTSHEFQRKNGPEIVSIWVLFSRKSSVCIEEPKALPIYTQRSSLKLEEEHITLRKFLRHIQHKINEEVVCKNVLET